LILVNCAGFGAAGAGLAAAFLPGVQVVGGSGVDAACPVRLQAA